MTVSFIKYSVSILLLLGLMACNKSTNSEDQESPLLAKVYNKSLHLDEMEGMFPASCTKEDSNQIINSYIERWSREMLLLHEAEKYIPTDLKIDEMVRKYRASLVLHNYETALVQRQLDSIVGEDELNAFYEKNKEQYQLETPIVQCRFVKVKRDIEELQKLDKWWNSDKEADKKQLLKYCEKNAEAYILDPTVWYDINELSLYLPKGTLTADNISYKRAFTLEDDEFKYYFERQGIKNRKEIAPLSYIEEQARKVILHQRKLELLEGVKNKLYDRELRNGKIQINFKE